MPEPVQPNPNPNPPAPPPGAIQNPPAPGNPPSPTPAPKPNGKGGSIYEDFHVEEPKPGAWSATWREDLATGADGKVDEKQLALLKRYDSPKAWHNAGMGLRQRLSSGEYKQVTQAPDAEKDPEGYATWRQENGLPVKPEDYQVLPEGVTLDKLDDVGKGLLGKLQAASHKHNLSPEAAKGMAGFWYEIAQEQLAQQAEADGERADTVEDTLRADWGPEYRNNIVMNQTHAEKVFGEELGALVFKARLEDGRRLEDFPEFSKAINAWARAEGGDIFIGGEGEAKTADSRIAEIEAIMASDMNKYLATPGMADEYGKLIEKREARKARQ